MKLDMSEPDDYSIAAALRGPDVYDGGCLKWIFSARLRTLVGVPHSPYYTPLTREEPIIQPESVDGSWQEGRFEHTHYLAHMNWAFAAIAHRLEGDEKAEAEALSRAALALSGSDENRFREALAPYIERE
jgi:hypothetical protein